VSSWRQRLAEALGGAQQRSYPDPPLPSNSSLVNRFGNVSITNESALRNSAVWACLSLRAGLVSSFPIRTYRERNGRDVEMSPPPVLRSPAGPLVTMREWMYSTQVDLDRAGNAFGLVRAFNPSIKSARWPLGLPTQIDLVQLGDVRVRRRESDHALVYVVGGKEYDWQHVWHEKAYTIAGLDVGLSPVAYAAYTLGGYLSAQQFALDWFNSSGMPAAHLKNTAKVLAPRESEIVKSRYESSVKAGGVFVTGNDWELSPMSAVTAQNDFITTMQYGVPDIARFFGCPADLIDGAVAGASITYANLSQRNLQFLITKLGPAVGSREDALSTLTPMPRFVKLDTDTLLRLDHLQSAQLDQILISSGQRVQSELRDRDNLEPYTSEQLAELEMMATLGKTGKPDTSKSGASA
jgi:HK97 family phage portal protein